MADYITYSQSYNETCPLNCIVGSTLWWAPDARCDTDTRDSPASTPPWDSLRLSVGPTETLDLHQRHLEVNKHTSQKYTSHTYSSTSLI